MRAQPLQKIHYTRSHKTSHYEDSHQHARTDKDVSMKDDIRQEGPIENIEEAGEEQQINEESSAEIIRTDIRRGSYDNEESSQDQFSPERAERYSPIGYSSEKKEAELAQGMS